MRAEEECELGTSGAGRLASDAMLREGIFAGGVGVWRWDAKDDSLICSDNMEQIHRLPEGSFDGTLGSLARGIHPEDRERALAAIRDAAQNGDRLELQYRLQNGPLSSTRWIESRGRVLRSPEGGAVGVTGTCQDITAHMNAEAELALRARQQEAIAQLGEHALAGADKDEVFAEAVRIAAEMTGADFAEILELSQDRGTLERRAGHGWQDDLSEGGATSEADTQIGMTLRSKMPVLTTDFSKEDRFTRPERLAGHDVQSGATIMIAGTEGNPFGILAVYCRTVRCIASTDIRFLQSIANVLSSAIRAAQDDERKELLIGELRHRVGNLFSLVQALHRQTGQNAEDARDLEMKFGSRLASLASAHSMILDGGWQKTSVRSLLETTLAPYIERVSFTGTNVRLPADAAFSFSMALHEMATNANKYGALSNEKGRLAIDCRSVPDALGEKLVLVWNEHDGPPPADSENEGFGSKLISQVVERQLGGVVTRSVQPDGLKFTIEFPIA